MAKKKAASVDVPRKLSEGEQELVWHMQHGYRLETDSLGGNPVLRFAELQLLNIEGAWLIANPDQRARVRNLLFLDGLSYFPDSGISNTSKSSLYSLLEAMTPEKVEMARPG